MSGEKTGDISSSVYAGHDQTDSPRRPSHGQRVFDEKDTDDTTVFYNKHKDNVRPLTPELESKVIRKNFWYLLIQTWWISFLIHLDKSTLSSASTMGIFKDVTMTKNEYNRLFILFYAGYLVALWPGAWISQRVGHKYFITGSLFLWALLLGVHPAIKTGRAMMAVRFLLGMVSLNNLKSNIGWIKCTDFFLQTESQIIPSTAVLHQAFFPPKRSPWVQLVWWAFGSMANVLLTMISYRLILDDNSGNLAGDLSSWKWLHIVCTMLTFIVFVPLVIFLPNSPLDAKWLSTEEKVHTIEIIRETHAGVSNSTFKWSQVRECFADFKSWLFM